MKEVYEKALRAFFYSPEKCEKYLKTEKTLIVMRFAATKRFSDIIEKNLIELGMRKYIHPDSVDIVRFNRLLRPARDRDDFSNSTLIIEGSGNEDREL